MRVRHLHQADRLLAIGRDTAPRLREPFRTADHGGLLYDERGLPRVEDFEFGKDCFGLDQPQVRSRWHHQRTRLARDADNALIS